MGALSNILGFAAVGLGARFGQLGIMKRNLFSNPGGHAISMAAFGFAGYWAYQWEVRASEIIAEKKAQLAERRQKHLEYVESVAAQKLAGSE